MDTPPIIILKEFAYEWSHDRSRSAARRYFRRKFRNPILLFFVCLAISLPSLAGFHAALVQHDPSGCWFYLIIPVLSLLPSLLLVHSYFKTLRMFAKLKDQRVTIQIEETGMIFHTNGSATSIKWGDIKRIWQCSDFWFISGQSPIRVFMPLPVAPLGAEMIKTIEDKIRQHGGQVSP
jgi:hypothetical protein